MISKQSFFGVGSNCHLSFSAPSYSYFQFIQWFSINVLCAHYQGYQVFLTSMLQQELKTLPRGVGRRLQMKPTTSATDDIAGVLKNQYETNTAPGILPGLSGICFIRFGF